MISLLINSTTLLQTLFKIQGNLVVLLLFGKIPSTTRCSNAFCKRTSVLVLPNFNGYKQTGY